MITYAEAVRQFRAEYLLDAVIEVRGNMCAAARLTGVHRNTIRRVLSDAGFNAGKVAREIKQITKPDSEVSA